MQMEKNPCVYILTNKYNTVLYTGVTSDLPQRMDQHSGNPGFGFTGRYNAKKLVYMEFFDDMEQAILREKQIKGGTRQRKIELIESINPEWKDISDEYSS